MPYHPFASAQGFVNRPTAAIGSGPNGASATKPYANYTPAPALSPYVNLFRNDNNNGTVNNYYTLVRPELEQRSYNRQAERQIQSIQTVTRLQSQQINQLNQRTPPQPAQFMNFQQYYPGYRSPRR